MNSFLTTPQQPPDGIRAFESVQGLRLQWRQPVRADRLQVGLVVSMGVFTVLAIALGSVSPLAALLAMLGAFGCLGASTLLVMASPSSRPVARSASVTLSQRGLETVQGRLSYSAIERLVHGSRHLDVHAVDGRRLRVPLPEFGSDWLVELIRSQWLTQRDEAVVPEAIEALRGRPHPTVGEQGA